MISFEDVVSVYGPHSNQSLLNVSWNLGTFCNYNCSYCWPNTHSTKYDFKSLSVYQLTLANLIDTAIEFNFEKIHINILGGELTAYKHFIEFIKYINSFDKIKIKINLVTNLSPSIKYWNEFIEHTKNIEMSITASYHIEFADLDSFLEKIEFIKSKNIVITPSVVMSPPFFDKLVPIAKAIKSKHKKFHFLFQYNEKKIDPSYTSEMIDIVNELNNNSRIEKLITIETKEKKHLLDNANILLGMNFVNYFGWDCEAGFNSIIIDKQLNVRRCSSGIDMPIGNLKTNFKLKKEKCISSACVCSFDLKVKKTRST
jgi:MoaA/NifB/PqqE/SkfB family radical SAM enzyme